MALSQTLVTQAVHTAHHRRLGNPTFRVDLSAINVPPESVEHVTQCLALGQVGQSAYVREFELAVAAYVGAKHCIATASGTLADAVAVAAMQVYFGVNRVIVPALTFVAQANAVRYNRLPIVWADVREDWTLDVNNLSRLGAHDLVFPVHIMGRMADVGRLNVLGALYIEDSCEAFGSKLGSVPAGRYGKLGSYSFFVSHTVTTGEGGAIVTDDDDLADLCRCLRSHGRASETDALRKFSFPMPGFNAKMSGLTAALGLGVMAHVRDYVAGRRAVFARMNERLGGRFVERAGEAVVPHGYPLEFESETARDAAMRALLAAGVECRKFFSVVPNEGAFLRSGQTTQKFPVAEHISRTHLYLPCHQNIVFEDVDWMCDLALGQAGLC